MTTDPLRMPVLLSLQRALLGEVFPALVAVCVSWSERAIRIRWFVDPPISDDNRESVSSVETEVLADFPVGVLVESEILPTINYDRQSEPGACVYARRAP